MTEKAPKPQRTTLIEFHNWQGFGFAKSENALVCIAGFFTLIRAYTSVVFFLQAINELGRGQTFPAGDRGHPSVPSRSA